MKPLSQIACVAVISFFSMPSALALADTPTPKLEVSGDAEVFVKPDAMNVVVGVSTFGSDHKVAMGENARVMTKVLRAAKALGIDAAKLKTQRIRLIDLRGNRSSYDRKGQKFQAENTLHVRVDELDLVPNLIGELIATGANRVVSISPIVNPDRARQKQLRAQAVANAKEVAGDYVSAAGVSLGKVLRISVSSTRPIVERSFAAARAAPSGGGAPVPVEPGLVRVSQRVNIVWALEQ